MDVAWREVRGGWKKEAQEEVRNGRESGSDALVCSGT